MRRTAEHLQVHFMAYREYVACLFKEARVTENCGSE
jgi:hypothetical protein